MKLQVEKYLTVFLIFLVLNSDLVVSLRQNHNSTLLKYKAHVKNNLSNSYRFKSLIKEKSHTTSSLNKLNSLMTKKVDLKLTTADKNKISSYLKF
jgi:hypothetical protein